MPGFDVLVVGAGVIGAACAYYAAREGLHVCLLDREDATSGATRACDGDVLAIGQAPGYKSRMARVSQELLSELVSSLDGDLDYKLRGSGLVVEEGQEEFALDWAKRLEESGLPVRYIGRDDALRSEPLLADDVAGMVECDSDSSLNPMELTYSMIRSIRRTPRCEARLQNDVVRILRSGRGQAVGVELASGDRVLGGVVVIACGVWTPRLLATVGREVPIHPRKGHLLVSERTSVMARRKLMEFGYLAAKYDDMPPIDVPDEMQRLGIAMVIEPTGHGNFLLGSSREFVGFDTASNPWVLELMSRRVLRFFPSLARVRMIRSYAGLRPYTPDGMPIVSPVEGTEGLFVAAGHEGSGVALAPITGRLVSEMILNRATTIPVEPLALGRFSGTSPISTAELKEV